MYAPSLAVVPMSARDDSPPADEPAASSETYAFDVDTLDDAKASQPPSGVRVAGTRTLAPEIQDRYSDVTPGKPGELGRGGMGVIREVLDRHLSRKVARKELLSSSRPSAGGQPSDTQRFLREARVTAQLEHPSIVPIYELGLTQQGRPYYTMRRVRGASLDQLLGSRKSLQERLELLGHLIDVCQALGYAHSRGVVHRDVKPANVMVGAFGETVLLDWGLARLQDDEEPEPQADEALDGRVDTSGTGRTVDGAVMGTPSYMSPEQAWGRTASLDARSDVWSLGAMLYELLCGAPPHEAHDLMHLLEKARSGVVLPAQEREPAAPPDLAAIAMKALAEEPKNRYDSAGQLAEELESWRSGRAIAAYNYSAREVLWRFLRRHKTTVMVGGVASLALIALGLGSYVRIGQERDLALVALEEAEQQRLLAEAGRQELLGSRPQALALVRAAADLGAAHTEAEQYRLATTGGLLTVLEGTDVSLAELAFSGDGAHLVAGGWEGGAMVWDLATGLRQDIATPDQGRTARAIGFRPGTNQVFVADEDGHAGLWGADDGELKLRLASTDTGITSWVAAPDGSWLAGGAEDGRIVTWNPETGQLTAVLEGHGQPISELAVSPDGSRLLVPAAGSEAWVWGIASAELLARLVLGSGQTARVAWSPAGNRLAAATKSGRTRIWDAASFDVVGSTEHGRMVRGLAFSPDGELIASGAQDGTVQLLSSATGELVRVLESETGAVRTLAFTPDGQRLVTGGLQGLVEVWDIASGTRLSAGGADSSHVGRVRASPSSVSVAAVTFAPDVYLWRDMPGLLQREYARPRRGLYREVAISGSGRWGASHARKEELTVYDLAAGREAWTARVRARPLRHVSFSPSGRLLAAASHGDGVAIVDVASGDVRQELTAEVPWGHSMGFLTEQQLVIATTSGGLEVHDVHTGVRTGVYRACDGGPDRELVLAPQAGIAVTMTDGRLVGWDLHRGVLLLDSVLAGASAYQVIDLSDDGSLVAYASSSGDVGVRRTASGEAVFEGRIARAQAADLSADGTLLAVGDENGGVHVLEVSTGAAMVRCGGHPSDALRVAFTPGSRYLVSTGGDELRVCDLRTGAPFLVASAPGTRSLALSSDGSTWISGGDRGTLRTWRLPEVEQVAEGIRSIGQATNLRVCRDSFGVVPVVPFPSASSVWAPARSCPEGL